MSPYQHEGSICHRRWCRGRRTLVTMNAIDINLNRYSNVTTGKFMVRVLRGNVVENTQNNCTGHSLISQMPWKRRSNGRRRRRIPDVIITEVRGTVGDIESLPFLEALRQMKADVELLKTLCTSTPLLPYLKAAGNENQADPTLCEEVRGLGVINMLVIRTRKPGWSGIKNKLAQFCVKLSLNHWMWNICTNPIELQAQNMDQSFAWPFEVDISCSRYDRMVCNGRQGHEPQRNRLNFLGWKYVELQDTYHFCRWGALKHSLCQWWGQD